MILYSYWRSTTSFRVRAALNLKGAAYRQSGVDLSRGDQHDAAFQVVNPGRGVPALVLEDGRVLTQSLAIIDHLDATHPGPRLLSQDPGLRARQLEAALVVATDIHPVNNLRVMALLRDRFGATPAQCRDWMAHWMEAGFATLEALLPEGATGFAFGDTPDLADLCIVAQCYNARRWGVDLAPFPKLARIEAACMAVPAIAAAAPEAQPDAPAPDAPRT